MPPIYTIVTHGQPAKRLPDFTPNLERAIEAASAALRTGTCTTARVYECSTVQLARTADISVVRVGERVVWQS
jgi:hypothetical protein